LSSTAIAPPTPPVHPGDRLRRFGGPCLVRFSPPFLDEIPDLGYRGAEEDAQEPIGGDLGPVLGALQLERIGLKVQKAGSCASRCY